MHRVELTQSHVTVHLKRKYPNHCPANPIRSQGLAGSMGLLATTDSVTKPPTACVLVHYDITGLICSFEVSLRDPIRSNV